MIFSQEPSATQRKRFGTILFYRIRCKSYKHRLAVAV